MGIPYFQSNLFYVFLICSFRRNIFSITRSSCRRTRHRQSWSYYFMGWAPINPRFFWGWTRRQGFDMFWPPVGSDGKTGRATAEKTPCSCQRAIPCHPQMLEWLVIRFSFINKLYPMTAGVNHGKSTTFEPTLLEVLTSLWDRPGRAVRWCRFMLIFSTWRTAGKWQGFKIWVLVNMKIH